MYSFFIVAFPREQFTFLGLNLWWKSVKTDIAISQNEEHLRSEFPNGCSFRRFAYVEKAPFERKDIVSLWEE